MRCDRPFPSARALVEGRKVAGLYYHAAGRRLRIAAGEHLQGYDGERDLRFSGTLPELSAGGASVHMQVEGTKVRGYDRGSSGHFTAEVGERMVQLYDHAEGAWFSYGVQVA